MTHTEIINKAIKKHLSKGRKVGIKKLTPNDRVVIKKLKNFTVATIIRRNKMLQGVAKRMSLDEFDLERGTLIALNRAVLDES